MLGYLCEVPVITGHKISVRQRPQLRLVVGLEHFLPGEILTLEFSVVQVAHNTVDCLVQFHQAVIYLLLQILKQMGLQPLNALSDSGFPLGLSGRRR